MRSAPRSTSRPSASRPRAAAWPRPSGAGLLLMLPLLLTAWTAPDARASQQEEALSRDPRIQRALDWLPQPPAVPIDIVDVHRLATRLAREVRTACGFIIRGVPRIYISSRCPAYQRAEHNPLEAIALAAVIGHEMAHLDGADETRAREVEADLVQTLAARLPGEYRVRAAVYVADLRHRRSPVVCETHPGGAAFHACRAEVVEMGGVTAPGRVSSRPANASARAEPTRAASMPGSAHRPM